MFRVCVDVMTADELSTTTPSSNSAGKKAQASARSSGTNRRCRAAFVIVFAAESASDRSPIVGSTQFPPTEGFQADEGDNVQSEFRVRESASGYRIELCRDGEPYVTFIDGLTRGNAEREVRSLTALWARISTHHPMREAGLAMERTVSADPRTRRYTRFDDWT